MRTLLLLALALPLTPGARAAEYLTGLEWAEPPVVTPAAEPAGPPSDATILFDGTSLDAWNGVETWKIVDGAMVVGRNYATTKQEFGDCQLHLEWSAPKPPSGTSQQRGNSGVFFMGKYEVQVLDSYENQTYFDGQAGAVYKQTPPMVNAMRPPGEWNTYDILWTCPRFKESGELESPATVTALHNGVLILNHFELLGNTPFDQPPRYDAHPPRGPIALQDHGNPVRYRNIWVRELKPATSTRVREPYMREDDREWPVAGSGPAKAE